MRHIPPIQPIQDFHLLPAKQITLDATTMYLLEGGDQEVIHLQLIFPAGRWFEQKQFQSLFTGLLLKSGTKSKTAYQLAETFDFYGANLSVKAGYDSSVVSLFTLAKHLDHVLPLLVEILNESTFPTNELEIERNRLLQALKVKQEKTDYLAQRLFHQKMYGEHPYGYAASNEKYQAIQQQDVIDFYSNYYSLRNGFAILAGKFSTQQVKQVQQAINQLNKQQAVGEVEHEAQHAPGKYHQLLDGAMQTSIRIGCEAVLPTHEDAIGLQVLNTVLGGYFGSRLMQNLREDKGMTYGVSSVFGSFLQQGYWLAATDVGRQYAQQAIDEIYREIDKLQQELVPEEELQLVKNYLMGRHLSKIDGPFAQSVLLKSLILRNQTAADYTARIQSIQSITSEQLLQLANQYFDASKMVEVAV